MKRLLITFILASLIAACMVRGPNPDPKVSRAPGEVAFGPLAGMDKEKYLFEQHALLRNKFLDRGVMSEIKGDMLQLSISGNITFSINSAKLNWNVHSILDRITPILSEYKYTTIEIYGHSDARGDKVINQRLSERRANVIRDYFIRSGIDSRRVIAKGLGDDDLLIQDDITTVDRALNRRITLEIKVIKIAEETPLNSLHEEVPVNNISEEMPTTDLTEEMPAADMPKEMLIDDMSEEKWLDKAYD